MAPKPIATAADTVITSNGPEHFEVSVYDLRRAGSFLVLDFGVRCLTPSPGCQLYGAFSPYVTSESSRASQSDAFTPAGITLVDPVNLREYRAARDSDQRPFASVFGQGTSGLSDSLVHLQWVRYALAPAPVTSMDVTFPSGGPLISHVPITSGSAPTAAPGMQTASASPFAESASASAGTTGLTLPQFDLAETTATRTLSDTESPSTSSLALRSDVLFAFNKSTLNPHARSVLTSVAAKIKSRARGTVQVTGYTDSIGSAAFNLGLSQRRAGAVVGALTPLTPGVHYTATGRGEADPIAPNIKPDGSDNPTGRALNRRVTVAFAVAAPPTPPPAPSAASATAPAGQTIRFSPPTSNGESTYGASVLSAYRDGGLLAIDLRISCVRARSGNPCAPTLDLGGNAVAPPQVLSRASGANSYDPPAQSTISGFYLEDPTTGDQYIPVHAGPGGVDAVPLTGGFAGQAIRVGQTYEMWALFSAPPPTTTSVTLVAPGASARLPGVTIASGPPAS